jgi:hypothetical protein
LAAAGEAYLNLRTQLSAELGEGLTDIYNRLNDPNEGHPRIARLREFHDAMNRAVLDAYEWSDIHEISEFVPEANGGDEDEDESKPRKYHYRWADETHDIIFVRLLLLNRERAEDETQVIAKTPSGRRSAKRGKRSSKRTPAPGQANLRYEESTE